MLSIEMRRWREHEIHDPHRPQLKEMRHSWMMLLSLQQPVPSVQMSKLVMRLELSVLFVNLPLLLLLLRVPLPEFELHGLMMLLLERWVMAVRNSPERMAWMAQFVLMRRLEMAVVTCTVIGMMQQLLEYLKWMQLEMQMRL